jgi:hypothetical protein
MTTVSNTMKQLGHIGRKVYTLSEFYQPVKKKNVDLSRIDSQQAGTNPAAKII